MTRRSVVEKVAAYVAELPLIVAAFTLSFCLYLAGPLPAEPPAIPYGVQQP